MKKLRMAVVGVGALGQHHARILSTFDDVELVGVVDQRSEQGEKIAAERSTQWYASVDQVLPLIDAAVLAVPTILHHDLALQCLDAGIPLLIEKPLAATLEEASRIHRIAQFRRTTCQVGHVERFNPAFQLLQQQVTQPLHIRCTRVSPYTFRSTDIGVVHDLMIHDIDLALALTNDQIASVDSFGAVTIGPHEDMAVARLKTERGVVIDLNASRMNPAAERSIQVWSADGFFSADLQTRQVSSWQPAAAFRDNPALVHSIAAATSNPMTLKDQVFGDWMQQNTMQASSADALTAELREFVDCVRSGRQPTVSSLQALQAMSVAEQVVEGLQLWNYQTGTPATTRKSRAA